MANLGKTTAEFQDQFRKMGRIISVWRLGQEFERRLSFDRVQVLEEFDDTEQLDNWNLVYGDITPGTNINEDGKLFVKMLNDSPSPGNVAVELYSDSGKSSLVATGSATKGSSITFVSAVNPAVTGTVDTTSTISANNTGIVLNVFFDAPKVAWDAFDDSRLARDAGRDFLNELNQAADTLGVKEAAVTAFNAYAQSDLKNFLGSAETSVIEHEEEVDANGNVTLKTRGILADLKDAMKDNTGGTSVIQTIKAATTSLSAGTFDSDNQGSGTVSTASGLSGLLAGSLVLRCVDETIGREEFEVSLLESDSNTVITADSNLRVGSVFRSSILRVTLEIDRSITDSGSGSADLSAYSFSGETDTNTNDGVLYGIVDTGTTGITIVTLHSAATRTTGNKVASGSAVTGSITGISFTATAGSGLNGSATIVAAPVGGSGLVVNLNVFKIDDKVYFTATNDFDAKYAEFFAKEYNFELNETGATPTISDEIPCLSGPVEYDS